MTASSNVLWKGEMEWLLGMAEKCTTLFLPQLLLEAHTESHPAVRAVGCVVMMLVSAYRKNFKTQLSYCMKR